MVCILISVSFLIIQSMGLLIKTENLKNWHLVCLKWLSRTAPHDAALTMTEMSQCEAQRFRLFSDCDCIRVCDMRQPEASIARRQRLHFRLSKKTVLQISLCSGVAFMPHLKLHVSLSASAWTILLTSC